MKSFATKHSNTFVAMAKLPPSFIGCCDPVVRCTCVVQIACIRAIKPKYLILLKLVDMFGPVTPPRSIASCSNRLDSDCNSLQESGQRRSISPIRFFVQSEIFWAMLRHYRYYHSVFWH